MKQSTVLFVFAYLSVIAPLQAGVLSDFERDVTTPTTPQAPDLWQSDPDGCFWYQDCETSMPEDFVSEPTKFYPREDVTVRMDIRYHTTVNTVSAYELRMERVNRSFGVYAKLTKYTESAPAAELDLAGLYLLYRPPVQKDLTIDLGLGIGSLSGTEVNSGVSIFIPIRYNFNKNYSLDISLASTLLANPMLESSVNFVIASGVLHYSIGYNSLVGPNEKLQAPVMGIAYQW